MGSFASASAWCALHEMAKVLRIRIEQLDISTASTTRLVWHGLRRIRTPSGGSCSLFLRAAGGAHST